jgi:RHS repeat-associated protein
VQQGANWNVTAVLNGSGAVQERYVYDPYGLFTDPTGQQTTVLNADWSTHPGGSAVAWVYLHQGGRYDTASGLYNFRWRDYSPTLGRWMQQDRLGPWGGDSNLYRYLLDDPETHVDPEGLQTVPPWWPGPPPWVRDREPKPGPALAQGQQVQVPPCETGCEGGYVIKVGARTRW